MHAEITTTLAGAGFVLAVAFAGGVQRTPAPSLLSHSPLAHPSAQHEASPAERAGTLVKAPAAPGLRAPAPGLQRGLPPVPQAAARPRAAIDGLAGGVIISADNLVFLNPANVSHAVTVRPADRSREFKARVIGMGTPRANGPCDGGEADGAAHRAGVVLLT